MQDNPTPKTLNVELDEFVEELLLQPPALVTHKELADYKSRATALIQNRIKEELEAISQAGYDDILKTYDYNRIVETLHNRLEELNNVGN